MPFSAGLLVRFAPLGRPRSRQWSQVGHDGGLLRPSTIQVAILSALSALGCCQSCLLDADALLPLNAGLAGWQPGIPAAAERSGPIGAQDWQPILYPLKHVVSPKPARGTIISLNPAVSAEPKAGWCSWLGEMLGESGGFCRRSTLRATGGVAQATPQFGQVRPRPRLRTALSTVAAATVAAALAAAVFSGDSFALAAAARAGADAALAHSAALALALAANGVCIWTI